MPIETINRVITKPVEQVHYCACGRPATSGCTDALQGIGGEWTEGEMRYGCAQHPATPLIYFLDSRVMTAKEYEGAL